MLVHWEIFNLLLQQLKKGNAFTFLNSQKQFGKYGSNRSFFFFLNVDNTAIVILGKVSEEESGKERERKKNRTNDIIH